MRESLRDYCARKRGVAGIVAFVAVLLSFFQLYTGLYGSLDALMQRTIHLGLALLLVFFTNPFAKGKEKKAKISPVDIILQEALSSVGYRQFEQKKGGLP